MAALSKSVAGFGPTTKAEEARLAPSWLQKLGAIGNCCACNRLKRSDVNAKLLNYKVGLNWEAGILPLNYSRIAFVLNNFQKRAPSEH